MARPLPGVVTAYGPQVRSIPCSCAMDSVRRLPLEVAGPHAVHPLIDTEETG